MMEQWNNGRKKKYWEYDGMREKKCLYSLETNIPKFHYSIIPAFGD
jgi:hypothetical protein